ncbi:MULTISPECIES: DegT/DnrJ/EryC1/StrS family aminotransferase [Leptospira]|uniref:DegT/DnrJ/EryC1/StrS aminotransferase family protein n=1 Tax=Leptospira borgpetersenii serovar Javanica str. UI 09931 TaxID=1049767 RepID=A0AAV3J831_LEPBO|nr:MULTISPECIES: DegT/DnrJ/EryC1/StrS family aminotransferase [Leptospira]AXX16240.1 DegT/DnrJ/EryC1/StrS family aminotransferase [Leptospira borgpetersenii serovar Ceylonica]EKQ89994.1 DegT/DnrJ/EryC1/StrS aminotransferase family protein [Leptospira borgpetersenii str. UI 09149]EMK08809.1 DegT/DnrJ/EryC1/StrS aminotransferase family protein [Leptospira sp. serovar Kenya str. Sh9]EMN58580.1 DegT/DnrJ/EryC1/StrS aminotransferase family protein [Leptospira borgpetersenii serovar Javanica str. MK1
MDFKIKWSGRSINYTQEEIDTVVEVMKTADPQTQGKYLQQFESDFSNYLDGQPCFGVTNATHALELIADLADLKSDDEIIIPGHTYCASAIPFGRTGAKLVWADIDPETFLVSFESIQKLVTNKTKAIVVVHLYGMIIPDIVEIAKFAKSKNILLIEDCAQSLGAILNGKSCGTFGDFAAFSFHGQKNITTMGEGGILTLKNTSLAGKVPGLRHNGHAPFLNKTDYWKPAMSNVDVDLDGIWPHNFSLTEVQAALGSVLLKRIALLTEERRKRAQKFIDSFSEFEELSFQKQNDSKAHSYHLLVAKYKAVKNGKNRDDLISILSKKFKIQVIVQYYPLYRYDLFKKMGHANAICPASDDFFDNMVSFPFHIWMSENDFDYMGASIKQALIELRN